MLPGTQVRAVRALEAGIPILEGETYTVLQYHPDPSNIWGGGLHPGRPGVTLQEVEGRYFADRFEVIQ